MNFSRADSEIFVPDQTSQASALRRITHLGIGAHQDDLEFMALHGVITCLDDGAKWFGGVTCGDGAGSPRSDNDAGASDIDLLHIRRTEQNRAAQIGRYGVMVQFGHPSRCIQDPHDHRLRDDLSHVLRATLPRVVYTHNLADKHATHVGVAVAVIQAIRSLPPGLRPEVVHGCEVWRGLDWMMDNEKIIHDLGGHESLAEQLNAVFASQITAGKRYDHAVSGRRKANATFFNPHAVDAVENAGYAMDLSPLVRDDSLDIAAYVEGFIERFSGDVRGRINACLGR